MAGSCLRPPVAQQEASGWWDTPPTLHGLHPQGFLPPSMASDPQNLWGMRQEKMLALGQALQTCAEASMAKTGILWEVARELQQCKAPLMTLNGDNVVKASLLRLTGKELGPSSTPEEETALLGKKDGPLGILSPTPRHSEIPRLAEPAEQTTTPGTSTASHSQPSWKEKKLWEGIDVNPNNPSKWVQTCLERADGSQSGGRNSVLLSTLQMGVVTMPKPKVWLASKLEPSDCQPPRMKYTVPRSPHPAWQH